MNSCCKGEGSKDSTDCYDLEMSVSKTSKSSKSSKSSKTSKSSKLTVSSVSTTGTAGAQGGGRSSDEECIECMDAELRTGATKEKIPRGSIEKEYEKLQIAFFALTSHFAKVQFRLRQIIQAQPFERDSLLLELASVAFCGIEEFSCSGMPKMDKDLVCLGNIRRRQGFLINHLRDQMEVLSESTLPDVAEEDDIQDDPKAKKK